MTTRRIRNGVSRGLYQTPGRHEVIVNSRVRSIHRMGGSYLVELDDSGRVVHARGVTKAPGLYVLGLSWQHARGLALIGWLKDDAEHLAEKISDLQPAARANASVPAAA